MQKINSKKLKVYKVKSNMETQLIKYETLSLNSPPGLVEGCHPEFIDGCHPEFIEGSSSHRPVDANQQIQNMINNYKLKTK